VPFQWLLETPLVGPEAAARVYPRASEVAAQVGPGALEALEGPFEVDLYLDRLRPPAALEEPVRALATVVQVVQGALVSPVSWLLDQALQLLLAVLVPPGSPDSE
jgi:hypothetical protein